MELPVSNPPNFQNPSKKEKRRFFKNKGDVYELKNHEINVLDVIAQKNNPTTVSETHCSQSRG